MRFILPLSLAFLFYVPVQAHAGNIYGSLWLGGKPVPKAEVVISCPGRHSAQTDGDGSYQVFVPEKGRCNFQVTYGGKSGVTDVASYDNPIKYDFDLLPQGSGYTLSRR
jgi:hypothetical protein